MMNVEKFTTKSREALLRAQQTAESAGHTELRPLHLLAALLEDDASLVISILEKLGVNKQLFRDKTASALAELPRMEGRSEQQLSSTREFSAMLSTAMKRPPKWATSTSAWNICCWR